MDIINFITTIPLFQNLEDKNYQDLSGIIITRKFKKGDLIKSSVIFESVIFGPGIVLKILFDVIFSELEPFVK